MIETCIFVVVKKIYIIFLSVFVFLAGFQKSLVFFDYQMNRQFYEAHCINKNKPELSCHGKCQSTKESEKQSSDLNGSKLGFEFSLINDFASAFRIPKLIEVRSNPTFSDYQKNPKTGFTSCFPKPPQA